MSDELIATFEKNFAQGPTIAVSLRQPAREFSVTVLFGPSGCGKTTVLRSLAGLEHPDAGRITFAGETWFDAAAQVCLPPQRRDIGFLFQDYALFPHLSVIENIAYGLRRVAMGERRRRVDEIIAAFQLDGLGGRLPHEISGGQQQRVALARTLVRRPRLLLLDEPLSALDAQLRDELRGRLRQLLRDFAVPTVVVTHDRTEAIALADQVVVIDGGRVLQTGTVADVFSRPADLTTARIVGVETVAVGEVVNVADGLATVRVGSAMLSATVSADGVRRVHVCIKGEDVALAREPAAASSPRNRLACSIRTITPEGALVRIGLDAGFALTALITRPACEELRLQVGDSVTAVVKAPAIHLIPRD